jgi:CheY-like chemotaxis protein
MESVFSKTPIAILGKTRLLVVDQDARNAALMSNVLNTLGFSNVHAATNGFEAVDVIRDKKIDLVITDWDLNSPVSGVEQIPDNPIVVSERWTPVPPSNGAYFVRYLRNSKYSPNPYIPVIMLTGMALRSNIEYARDSGVDEVLLKPVTAESLCSRISMVVDHNVPFVTSDGYKGPCRRRRQEPLNGAPDRRKKDIVLIKHQK